MIYTRPPLPFMGNKKNQLKNIQEVLSDMAHYITPNTIFYDVFGGSGLIAHNIKQRYPEHRVIWNDYDNYQERLDNIQTTDKLKKEILSKVAGIKKYKDAIPQEIREQILEIIKDYDNKGFVDYMTLSVYLLFYGNYAKNYDELAKFTFYNRFSFSPLECKGYLAGVERVSCDFTKLFNSIEDWENAFLILDPPYLQAHPGNYKSCFRLRDMFNLLKFIKKPYIYFGNKNSDVIEFMEVFKEWNKELENYTYNKAYANIGSVDFIIYPRSNGLFD